MLLCAFDQFRSDFVRPWQIFAAVPDQDLTEIAIVARIYQIKILSRSFDLSVNVLTGCFGINTGYDDVFTPNILILK